MSSMYLNKRDVIVDWSCYLVCGCRLTSTEIHVWTKWPWKYSNNNQRCHSFRPIRIGKCGSRSSVIVVPWNCVVLFFATFQSLQFSFDVSFTCLGQPHFAVVEYRINAFCMKSILCANWYGEAIRITIFFFCLSFSSLCNQFNRSIEVIWITWTHECYGHTHIRMQPMCRLLRASHRCDFVVRL